MKGLILESHELQKMNLLNDVRMMQYFTKQKGDNE